MINHAWFDSMKDMFKEVKTNKVNDGLQYRSYYSYKSKTDSTMINNLYKVSQFSILTIRLLYTFNE